jgi:hypothetical protein
MPPSRILALRVAVCAGLVVALLAIFAGVEGPRSALARFALGVFLAQHGMHIESGDLRLGSDRISATNFEIDDDEGRVLSVERLAVDYDWRALFGASDRRYGLRAVDVHAPALRVLIRPDGSTNLSTFANAGGAAAPAPAPAPSQGVAQLFDVSIAVDDGRIDVENPTSYAVPGRWFSLTGISAGGALHGGVGRATLRAQFVTPGVTSPITANAVENDALGFAQVRLHAPGAPLAPALDAFISTSAFVTEGGVADVSLSIFDVGFSSAGPRWRVSGIADVREGRIRVTPLDVPVRDITGRLSLEAGYLGFDALRGTTASLPTYGRGSIRLLPSVRFAFAVDARGDLHEARRLFAFSRDAPLRGPIAARVRVDGPLDDVHASGEVRGTDGALSVAAAPVRNARATFYYQNGHVTLPHFEAAYDGARVFSDGDIALAQSDTRVQFQAVATASAPANDVPVIANLNRGGTARMLASVDGPVDGAQFHAFAQTLGGTGAGATVTLGGVIGASAAAAARIVWPRGDVTLRAGTQDLARDQALFVSLIATHAPLHVMAGGAMLPGMAQTFSLPQMDASVDGVAYLGSPQPQSAANVANAIIAAVDLRARNLVVQGDNFGTLLIRAHGNMARVAIDALSVDGRDARVRAAGAARIEPQPFNVAGVLGGTASLALAPLAAAMPLPARGSIAGDFEAVSSRSGWAAMLQSSGGSAAFASAPLRDIVLLATAASGGPIRFAARAGALRGDIAAFGTTASAHIYGSGIDLAALGLAQMPLDAGIATVIAHVAPSGSNPAIAVSVALSGGRMRSTELDGSADLTYAARVLRATGNIDVAHSRMRVDATARGVAPGIPLSAMTFNAIASVRDGDLEALTRPYLPHSLPLTGSLDADVALHGSVAAPVVTGRVNSPAATLRGVTVLDTGGTIAYEHGSFALDDARSQLGSSLLGLSGRYRTDGAQLDARSAHIDLSDFNNFFAGRYVLDGTGTISLALALAPHSTHANGGVALRDAFVLGAPVGDVRLALASSGPDGAHVDLAQRSVLGATEFSGDVAFAQHDAVLPDVRRATFRASAQATGVDVRLAARLAGLEDVGLRGVLDATGSMHGTFARPFADVAFDVRGAAMRTLELREVRGHIESDASSLRLRDAVIGAPFGQASANAELQRSGAVSGSAHVSVTDLHGVAQPQTRCVAFDVSAHLA